MGRKKVLVVEDDTNLKNLLKNTLVGKGYSVLVAGDGETALGLADEADVILLDLRLPRLSGEEFLKKIREGGNAAPTIIMTAHIQEQGLNGLMQMGIVDFVTKPFSMKLMAQKIDNAASVAEDVKSIGESSERLKELLQRIR